MALHRLNRITLGVPNVDETCAYYRDFGLAEVGNGRFATRYGGEQLAIVHAPRRRLIELGVGANDADDLGRIAANLTRLGLESARTAGELRAIEPSTRTEVVVSVTARVQPGPEPATVFNGPGRGERIGARAAGAVSADRARPRKLGHLVLGSTDAAAARRFFVEGLGFKVSDEVGDVGAAFLRCSSDHHNVLVQPAPVSFLHHTAWEVGDVDEIGRGAARLISADASRHLWGLGRHCVGSNFFWYLRDPAGNFTEYYSDLDVIVDDELWKPEVWSGLKSLMAWGPSVPPEFLMPPDLLG